MDNTKKDLREALALSSGRLQLLGIKGATTERLSLKLNVWLHIVPTGAVDFFEIICINAVDYAIRPRDPNCIEGGPLVELHERHPWLDHPRLQGVPGGDGEMFDPPLKLKLLILDQSHVIAENFEIQPWNCSDSENS